MKYTILILPKAKKALEKIANPDYERIRNSVYSLADNPRPRGCKKLTNRQAWRIRIGNYRVIYEIDDENITVLVLRIRHRRDVYN